jgi:hypothetical protein
MGFDLTVGLNVGIDPKTGMAFVYAFNTNVGVKPFVPSEYTVPEKYRNFLQQRGSHFHQYIKKYCETMNMVDAEQFLYDYPDWRLVKKELNSSEDDYSYWTKEHHDGFKQALTWMCSGKNSGLYSIRWSY